jgi:hypothetical protein
MASVELRVGSALDSLTIRAKNGQTGQEEAIY